MRFGLNCGRRKTCTPRFPPQENHLRSRRVVGQMKGVLFDGASWPQNQPTFALDACYGGVFTSEMRFLFGSFDLNGMLLYVSAKS